MAFSFGSARRACCAPQNLEQIGATRTVEWAAFNGARDTHPPDHPSCHCESSLAACFAEPVVEQVEYGQCRVA
jgi:hypothetical protein